MICNGCGENFPAGVQGKFTNDPNGLPDNGWSFSLEWLGYYAGFTDYLGSDEPLSVFVCHDCIVKVLTALPQLGKRVGQGAHPSPTPDKPCCKWSYKWVGENDIYFSDDDGNWVIGERVPKQEGLL